MCKSFNLKKTLHDSSTVAQTAEGFEPNTVLRAFLTTQPSSIVLYVHLWSPYVIGQTIYIFILFLSFFFFFPRLISAVGDWMSTILWHMVWS